MRVPETAAVVYTESTEMELSEESGLKQQREWWAGRLGRSCSAVSEGSGLYARACRLAGMRDQPSHP